MMWSHKYGTDVIKSNKPESVFETDIKVQNILDLTQKIC